MASEFFMIFRLLFWRRRAATTGNLGLNLAPLLQGQNSGRNTVARDERLRTDSASPDRKSCQSGILSRKTRVPSEGIRDWNVDLNGVSSTSIFLTRTVEIQGYSFHMLMMLLSL